MRNGRDVPDQTDIDPRAVKRLLASIFILDAANPGQPAYRLAGTGLCERFGMELKGMGFLLHWDGQSRTALSALMRQAMKLRQPICLSSIGASADSGMVELETMLLPISLNGGEPTRFLGMTLLLSDPMQIAGRTIAFQRLVASQIVRESEPLANSNPPVPPAPAVQSPRNHPRAPHLRLVVSRERSAIPAFQPDKMLQRVFDMIGGTVRPA
ncbi:MAG: PAS domain-containing protein [Rhizomicrobium sp.]